MNRNADTLTVLDGVVIAIGWCEDANPEIVVGDQAPDQQLRHRFDRPDIGQFSGTVAGQWHGFRSFLTDMDID